VRIIRYLDGGGDPAYACRTAEGKCRKIQGDIFGTFQLTRDEIDASRLLAPVAPPLIVGVGLNYREHAKELGMPLPEFPVIFYKSPFSVLNPGDPIRRPPGPGMDKLDYECELAVVIGRECRDVAHSVAFDYVLGYTCANDVSERNWQLDAARSGSQWCRGKSFDTFCPLGPAIVTLDEIRTPHDLRIQTLLNGEVMQDSRTSDMIFDIPRLIEFASIGTTLPAGTVMITGTPPGIGMSRTPPRYLQEGDDVVIEIEGIGRLENPVTDSPRAAH